MIIPLPKCRTFGTILGVAHCGRVRVALDMNGLEAVCILRQLAALVVLSPEIHSGRKAENLAQKEDLRAFTEIVEGVRAQFERAKRVHRAEFEAEFKACQDVWREANKPTGKLSDFIPLLSISLHPFSAVNL